MPRMRVFISIGDDVVRAGVVSLFATGQEHEAKYFVIAFGMKRVR